ncbi:MAG: hypothetical protein ACJ75J_06795 [Cytophagaceae bacterium]
MLIRYEVDGELEGMENRGEEWKNQLSDIYVNSKGQLCQMLNIKSVVLEYVFNSLRDDNWLGIYFSFNPKFISKTVGW